MNVVDPVFVDRSGRRRRLFTSLGAGLGVLLAASCLLLVAGLLGSSPVPLPGLPQGGQGGQHRDGAESGVGSAPSPTGAPTPAGGAGGAAAATPQTAGSPSGASATATEPHDNRKTSHPGNPKPSRTK
ncbi:hypothetical protein OHA72_05580 [Dactylosporangium sp. NBC_01737]|uniref:hypothetical protein n=1 Tax=Dactylosporangium sp. NBC_01737 TaxID=2975959 RepID=UPI002E13469A|nr:hypothetical protein OHA72_05580 [Dactylosporangium sp. NBC_01737]